MRLPPMLASGRVYIASSRNLFWNLLLFFLVGVLVCRGALEAVMPKSVAMVFQLAVVLTTLTALFLVHINTFTRREQFILLLCLGFTGVIGLSALMTTLIQDFHYWAIYAVFNLYLLWVAIGSIRLITAPIPPIAFHRILLIWGWLLFFVSCLEQIHKLTMPGYSFIGSFIRSASLTGSFLHYPIVIALLGGLVLQWGMKMRSAVYWGSGIVFCMAPLLVLSRSGIFIVFFAMGLAWLGSLVRAERAALWTTVVIGILVVGVLGLSNGKEDGGFADKVVERVANAGKKKSAGNEGRIKAWRDATEMWTETNLVIGEYAGAITNSTKNLFKGKSDVAESGVLQQLVNFGMAGLVLFYALLVLVFSHIRKEHRWMRCIYLAALTQTLFYQSIEVVPFVTLLLLMPWISHCFAEGSRQLESVAV